MIQSLRCIRCDTAYPVEEMPEGCPECLAKGKPASVAPQLDLDGESSRVVIVLTANGLTSPQDIVSYLPPLVPVEPTADALLREIRY